MWCGQRAAIAKFHRPETFFPAPTAICLFYARGFSESDVNRERNDFRHWYRETPSSYAPTSTTCRYLHAICSRIKVPILGFSVFCGRCNTVPDFSAPLPSLLFSLFNKSVDTFFCFFKVPILAQTILLKYEMIFFHQFSWLSNLQSIENWNIHCYRSNRLPIRNNVIDFSYLIVKLYKPK